MSVLKAVFASVAIMSVMFVANQAMAKSRLVATVADWGVYCDRKLSRCSAIQNMSVSGRSPASISVFPVREGKAVTGVVLTLPEGAYLRPGIILSVDARNHASYDFTACERSFCIAQVGLTAKRLKAFKNGGIGLVEYWLVNSPKQKRSNDFSLRGFEQAYAEVERRMKEGDFR